MKFKIIFLWVLSFMTITIIKTDKPECNQQIPPMNNYDASKMGGVWYVQYLGDENKSKKDCMVAVMDVNTPGKLILNETGILEGKYHELTVDLTQVGSSSEYIARSSAFPPSSCWVMDTDYTTYSVWFLCLNGLKQDGITHICTRDKHPSADVLKKAEESIVKAGLKIGKDYSYPVDQSNC